MTKSVGNAFETLLEYLRQTRGFDFSSYKRSTLVRRVERRLQQLGLEDFQAYMDYLEVHPEEFTSLFNTILINVTSFFRDPPAWEQLTGEVVPRILEAKGRHGPIRIWSAGCASGQEPYSLAMVLAEALGPEVFHERVKIYASDLDDEALAQARQGSYSSKEAETIPAALRDKYFEQLGDRYVFRADLRRSVIFGRHDLVQDAPISRLDLLVCRNTLMYFNGETQARIVARFHFALSNPGFLFLGKAEMLLSYADLFTPLDLKQRIFARHPQTNARNRVLALAQPGGDDIPNHAERQVHLDEAALDAGPAAIVIVDAAGHLAMANEPARVWFGVSPRDVGRPFKDLELSYRPLELRSLIEQVSVTGRAVKAGKTGRVTLAAEATAEEARVLDVVVKPLLPGGRMSGVAVVFEDVTTASKLQAEVARTRQDLETTSEELQSANEELETTNEELQSTNEELETTNEELQSTNEELETMNEELQSTNEELHTINEELRKRTYEANHATSFLESVFAGLRAGVVVVDRSNQVQVWNERAEDLWGLRAEEVRGRSFFELDIGLPADQLASVIRSCLSGASKQQEIVMLDARDRRGRPFKCRVSCSAQFGAERTRQGVILLMEDWDAGGGAGAGGRNSSPEC